MNQMVHVVVILVASLGFRIGELLPPRVGSRVPHSHKIKKKLLMISNISFTNENGHFDSVALYKSIQSQVHFLVRVIKDPKAQMGIIALCTKNKRDRIIGVEHQHFKASTLLCPICNMCRYLVHRILVFQKCLYPRDVLFVLLAKQQEVIFPATTMRDTLTRLCEENNFYIIHPHDFKRGVLT